MFKDPPSLKDLYENYTRKCATYWREIGILLGIHNEDLEIIKNDNFHAGAVCCCNAMFQKWLETDKSASWEGLLKAIELVSADKDYDGVYDKDSNEGTELAMQ